MLSWLRQHIWVLDILKEITGCKEQVHEMNGSRLEHPRYAAVTNVG